MRLKKFNEEVGFDSEDLRDRLEIPNLKGEFEPGSPTMKPFSLPLGGKIDTKTELSKLIYKFPILSEFHTNKQFINGTDLISFYATSKTPVNGDEFYCQFSFAFHNNKYFVGTILRNRQNVENESEWIVHNWQFEKIDYTYDITKGFIEACSILGVLDDDDLSHYAVVNN